MNTINRNRKKASLVTATLGIFACLFSPVTLAAPVAFGVDATADNDFIILHSQGNSHDVVFRSQDNDKWKKAQTAKFEFDVKSLKGCSIDIIAWNDHKFSAGLAATITSNAGQIHSGGTEMVAYATTTPNQAQWASTGYPNNNKINNIMNSLVANTTHDYGFVGSTAPWGNTVSGISAPAKWIWAAKATNGSPYIKNFTVYRTACSSVAKLPKQPKPVKKGMTWRKKGVDAVTGAVTVGCKQRSHQDCDPIRGDTMCTKAMPMLCAKHLKLPKPVSLAVSRDHQWSGNVIGTTKPVAPASAGIDTLTKANTYCEKEFGSGWKVAGFHDATQWNFKAYGNIGTNVKRFWVNIKDQRNGNCWTQ